MKTSVKRSLLPGMLCLLALTSVMPVAQADAAHRRVEPGAAAIEETPYGKPGDPHKLARAIVIDMYDSMRFGPQDITVRQGETIRFVVKNKGLVLHEMVLGTMATFSKHQEMMKQHPGMEHEEPQAVHVKPGKKKEMAWQFTQPGKFHFACLIPGHFEAGMIGNITVTKG